VARDTRASFSSVDGEIVQNGSPDPSTHSPSMNSPYSSRSLRMLRDSGAGAYSRKSSTSVHRHVVGAAVPAARQFVPLHEHVVEQRRGAEPEQVRLQPPL